MNNRLQLKKNAWSAVLKSSGRSTVVKKKGRFAALKVWTVNELDFGYTIVIENPKRESWKDTKLLKLKREKGRILRS
ncbi:unnamed protein product [Citrullus colocynthis]|uniref:Uncharacterized protein n=1 Tax=Citrullus colocynthis TaxID=252529 RepID=A0ABP0YUM4_9ROSI